MFKHLLDLKQSLPFSFWNEENGEEKRDSTGQSEYPEAVMTPNDGQHVAKGSVDAKPRRPGDADDDDRAETPCVGAEHFTEEGVRDDT